MSEKRTPYHTILLRLSGKKRKTNKIELFLATDWNDGRVYPQRYRIRLNGKWWSGNGKKYFTKTEVKELVFRAI